MIFIFLLEAEALGLLEVIRFAINQNSFLNRIVNLLLMLLTSLWLPIMRWEILFLDVRIYCHLAIIIFWDLL